jgi:hypothetical protein
MRRPAGPFGVRRVMWGINDADRCPKRSVHSCPSEPCPVNEHRLGDGAGGGNALLPPPIACVVRRPRAAHSGLRRGRWTSRLNSRRAPRLITSLLPLPNAGEKADARRTPVVRNGSQREGLAGHLPPVDALRGAHGSGTAGEATAGHREGGAELSGVAATRARSECFEAPALLDRDRPEADGEPAAQLSENDISGPASDELLRRGLDTFPRPTRLPVLRDSTTLTFT